MKILLSIRPEYARRILDGTKRFEFRKRIHRDPRVQTVVIYATMPVGMVIGEFTIESVHADDPESLWEHTKEHSGISKEFFSSYFHGRDVAYAIEIKKVRKFRKPKSVSEYLASGIAPQSYAYVD
ncbi:ASCH domain-containing protein [Gemmatimonas sp.]|uniref:ASCH domain-containing protein n=1 Tax=Gemmatimonas sp. TaxID=1962908 RepID=UPI0031F30A74